MCSVPALCAVKPRHGERNYFSEIYQQICWNSPEFLFSPCVPYRLNPAASVYRKLTNRMMLEIVASGWYYVQGLSLSDPVLIPNYHVMCSLLQVCLCQYQMNTCLCVFLLSFSLSCCLCVGCIYLLGFSCFHQ